MRVKDCMCSEVVQATPDTTLSEIAKLMDANKVGCVPVCNNNVVVGFVTDRDIITRCVANNKNCSTTKVSDIMNTNVVKTTPDTDICSAIEVMRNNQIRRLPVVEGNKVVGMLSLGDLAQNQDVNPENLGHTLECICEDSCDHCQ